MFKLEKLTKYAAGAIVGNWIADAFLVQASPNDQGIVLVGEGFGADDIVRAFSVAAGIVLVDQVL